MFCLYILQSEKDHNLYIGSTNNLKRRLSEHKEGKVFSTSYRRPMHLIYAELYSSEKDCRHGEKNLKLKSRAYYQLKKRISNCMTKHNECEGK